MLPDWLNNTDPREPPADWLAEARDRLDRGALTIGGPPGSGKSALGARLLARHAGPKLAVRLAGCHDAADVYRAVGSALGLALHGSPAAIREALARVPGTLVLLDEGANEAAVQAHSQLEGSTEGCRWVLTMSGDRGLQSPWTAQDEPDVSALPREAEWLALLPAGLRLKLALPKQVRLPHPNRAVLRSSAARALLRDRSPDPARVAVEVLPLALPLFDVTLGRAPRTGVGEADILLLRFLARHHPEAAQASRAAAAAARLVAAAGQLALARDLLERTDRPALALRDCALLDWAEGDVLLDSGLLIEATIRHREAVARFEQDRAYDLAATLMRRTADLLLARGLLDEAGRRYREARALHRRVDDVVGVAASLRGVGDLALASGEILNADTIYVQADEVLGDTSEANLERANLRLGQATLAIVRGEVGPAETLLYEAEKLAGHLPLMAANLARRRADLALRRGRHEEAMELLAEAIPAYQRAGHREAAAASIRLRGDVAAARGQRLEASEHYSLALSEAVRVGDLTNASRVLEHLLVLERTGDDKDRVEELLALREELDAELGHPAWRDGLRLRLE